MIKDYSIGTKVVPFNNAVISNPQHRMETDCPDCRMHLAHDAGTAECLMEVIRSQWATPFGDEPFCKHPSARQFVSFVNSYQPIAGDCSHDNSAACLNEGVAGQQPIVAEVLAALQADRLDLPVLPDMVRKIRNLLDDPDSSKGQFVQLISTDLSISLYIIKAANSAALSNGQQVSNLQDAIPRLGYRMLYSMVMDICLTKLFRANSPHIDRKLKELWEHSRMVAANCYVLAQQQKHLKPEDAMLAGLVHDIGALPLYLYADRHHPETDPLTLEKLINQFSASVGVKMLQSWNFPEELIEVVVGNENQRRSSLWAAADYVDVVTMANLQVQSSTKDVNWRNVLAAERLRCYPGDCMKFLANHAEQFLQIKSMLGIGTAQAA